MMRKTIVTALMFATVAMTALADVAAYQPPPPQILSKQEYIAFMGLGQLDGTSSKWISSMPILLCALGFGICICVVCIFLRRQRMAQKILRIAVVVWLFFMVAMLMLRFGVHSAESAKSKVHIPDCASRFPDSSRFPDYRESEFGEGYVLPRFDETYEQYEGRARREAGRVLEKNNLTEALERERKHPRCPKCDTPMQDGYHLGRYWYCDKCGYGKEEHEKAFQGRNKR